VNEHLVIHPLSCIHDQPPSCHMRPPRLRHAMRPAQQHVHSHSPKPPALHEGLNVLRTTELSHLQPQLSFPFITSHLPSLFQCCSSCSSLFPLSSLLLPHCLYFFAFLVLMFVVSSFIFIFLHLPLRCLAYAYARAILTQSQSFLIRVSVLISAPLLSDTIILLSFFRFLGIKQLGPPSPTLLVLSVCMHVCSACLS